MWHMNQYTRCCFAIRLIHILLASSSSSCPLKQYQWIHSMIDSLLASSSSLFKHTRRIDSLFQFQSFPFKKKWNNRYHCSYYHRNGPAFVVDWSIDQRELFSCGTTPSFSFPRFITMPFDRNRISKFRTFPSNRCWLVRSFCFFFYLPYFFPYSYSSLVYRQTVLKNWSSLPLEAVSHCWK